MECITQLRLIFRKKKYVRTGEPAGSRKQGAGRKIWAWRDRIDEKTEKKWRQTGACNGLEFLTKVLGYRVSKKNEERNTEGKKTKKILQIFTLEY